MVVNHPCHVMVKGVYLVAKYVVQFPHYTLINYGRVLSSVLITNTYLYNFDPLKPHFQIVKLGFTGVHIILQKL